MSRGDRPHEFGGLLHKEHLREPVEFAVVDHSPPCMRRDAYKRSPFAMIADRGFHATLSDSGAVLRRDQVAELEKGITERSSGYAGKSWNILGQVYFPKATCESTFAFETNTEPGQFVPVHIHPTQDEFILVQEGVLDLKLDGKWVQAKTGDLVRLPRGIPHGYFNKSDKPARALFWVSPARMLEELFNKIHNVADPAEVIKISSRHEVEFLPPEANA
jgi:quercetin dioxygenase-like cupin family protein